MLILKLELGYAINTSVSTTNIPLLIRNIEIDSIVGVNNPLETSLLGYYVDTDAYKLLELSEYII